MGQSGSEARSPPRTWALFTRPLPTATASQTNPGRVHPGAANSFPRCHSSSCSAGTVPTACRRPTSLYPLCPLRARVTGLISSPDDQRATAIALKRGERRSQVNFFAPGTLPKNSNESALFKARDFIKTIGDLLTGNINSVVNDSSQRGSPGERHHPELQEGDKRGNSLRRSPLPLLGDLKRSPLSVFGDKSILIASFSGETKRRKKAPRPSWSPTTSSRHASSAEKRPGKRLSGRQRRYRQHPKLFRQRVVQLALLQFQYGKFVIDGDLRAGAEDRYRGAGLLYPRHRERNLHLGIPASSSGRSPSTFISR